MMHHATAYQRGDSFYLHSESQTTSGVWIAVRPFIRLPRRVSAEELGAAVEETLAASQLGVTHPTDWDTVEYPLPTLAGVKSWATFMRTASCVNIKEMNGYVEMRPSKNIGPKEGYEPMEEVVTIRGSIDPERLGIALLDAFRICK